MAAMMNGAAALTPQEKLQARLSDPRTVDALNRLLDRLDVIAFSVEAMEGFLRRGSEVADNVAEGVEALRGSNEDAASLVGKLPALARTGAKVAEVGDSPAFDRLLHSGLLERLGDPNTLETIRTLLDKLDVLAFSVQALDGFWRRSDVVADSLAESVGDLRKMNSPEVGKFIEHLPQLAAASVQLAETSQTAAFGNLLGMVQELGKPETAANLRSLLERLDVAVFALNAVEGFLRRSDQVAESVSEGVGDLRKIAASVNTAELARIASELPRLTEAGHQLVASGLLDKVADLAEAGMLLANAGFFEPSTVKTLAEIGRNASASYTEAKTAPKQTYGLFDLMRVLKDPGVQRTVGLLVEAAKVYGRKMG